MAETRHFFWKVLKITLALHAYVSLKSLMFEHIVLFLNLHSNLETKLS